VLKYEGEFDRVKKLTDVINSLLETIRRTGKLDEDDIDIVIADIDRGQFIQCQNGQLMYL
jgi:hypothetical protein